MSVVVVFETVRRHCTNVLAVAFVVFLAILGLASSRLESRMWPGMIELLAIVVGASLIGPEFSSGTLQLVLVKPINRAVYLVSRVAGVVLFIAMAGTTAFAAEAIGRLIWGDADKIGAAAIMLLNKVSGAALTCALLALFGSFLRAYFNVALFWLIEIVLGLVQSLFNASQMAKSGFLGAVYRMLLRYPFIDRTLGIIQTNLYPVEPTNVDRDWLLLVWSNLFVMLVLACFFFRRREVPYGAD